MIYDSPPIFTYLYWIAHLIFNNDPPNLPHIHYPRIFLGHVYLQREYSNSLMFPNLYWSAIFCLYMYLPLPQHSLDILKQIR